MSKVSDDWYDLPRAVAGIKLFQIRDELREKNLDDTEEPPLESSTSPTGSDAHNVRTSDGTYNDLKCPRMGSAGMRFGRNVPLSEAFPDTANLLTPSPRRRQPRAADANHLPAGHDPQRDRRGMDPVHGPRLVRAQEGHLVAHPRHSRSTTVTTGTNGRCACRRRRRIHRRSPTRSGRRPTSTRTRTGGTARMSMAAARRSQASLRAGREGKVLVSPSGRLGVDPVTGLEITGFTENGWVGPQPAPRRCSRSSTTRSATS